MANINARSPYLVRVTDSEAESAQLEVWIYTGTQLTSHTSTPTYTLTSTMVNEEAVFDISPLIKDYFVYTNPYSTEAVVWVDYRVTKNLSEKIVYYYSSTFYSESSLTNSIGTLYFAHNVPDYDFNITGTSPADYEVFNVIYTDSSLQTPYTATTDIYHARTNDLYGYYALYGSAGLVTGYAQGLSSGQTSDSTYVSSKLVVETTQEAVVQNTAFNGYGYFGDDINPDIIDLGFEPIMTSKTEFFIPENYYFGVPLNVNSTGYTVTFYDSNNNSMSSYTTAGTIYSDEVLQYLTAPLGAYSFDIDGTVYNVNYICEPKYTPITVFFVNKAGATDILYFFKNSKLSLDTKEEAYRANIVSDGSYSTTQHQYKTLYKEGKESLTINSGFYPESYNEVFRQLLLSEYVWVQYGGLTLPCRIKDSSMSFKTQVEDKLINYTMNIEFAFDKINNVR